MRISDWSSDVCSSDLTSAESLARSAASCRQSCSLELSAGQQNGAPTLARSSRCLFRLVGRRNSWTVRHVPGNEIVYSVLLGYPVPRCLDFANIDRKSTRLNSSH